MNRKIKYILLGLVFWFLIFLGWEWWRSYPKVRFDTGPLPETRSEKIDSILIHGLTQYLIPGIAVGIVQEEKVIYLNAFGYENLTDKDSLSLDSKIPVVSLSHLVTALGIAHIALEKGISPDSNLNSLTLSDTYLPEQIGKLTLRDLLQHQTGLKVQLNFTDYLKRNKKKNLGDLKQSISEIHPSSDSLYLDLNIDLLGIAMENGGNQEFSKLIDERILTIGGMKSSFFPKDWPLSYLPTAGYQRTFLWKRLEPIEHSFDFYPSPSSGMISTAEDLSNFLLHLSREDMGVFSEELRWLRQQSETPVGFQKIEINQLNFIGHSGSQGGYSTLLIYSPELELGLFLMANSRDQIDFRNQIASQLLHLLHP